MTDREILEAAAKAAGINLTPYTWNKGTGWDHEGFTVAGEGPNEWNPIEDDGDALRLAVKLRIDIAHFSESVRADTTGYDDCNERNCDDPYAATRRAIVRAAAQIGRAK
jgi:predicted ATP-grasp superfamily ATP-dependent carboligase